MISPHTAIRALRWLRLGATAGAVALVVPANASAQRYGAELLFAGSVRPAVLFTGEWDEPLGPEPPFPMPGSGPIVVKVRSWLLTGRAGIGLTSVRQGNPVFSPTAIAELGLLRRIGGGLSPSAGLLALGSLHPEVAGPVARLEIKRLAGVEAGWVWRAGGGGALLIAADVSTALLCDLLCD